MAHREAHIIEDWWYKINLKQTVITSKVYQHNKPDITTSRYLTTSICILYLIDVTAPNTENTKCK